MVLTNFLRLQMKKLMDEEYTGQFDKNGKCHRVRPMFVLTDFYISVMGFRLTVFYVNIDFLSQKESICKVVSQESSRKFIYIYSISKCMIHSWLPQILLVFNSWEFHKILSHQDERNLHSALGEICFLSWYKD